MIFAIWAVWFINQFFVYMVLMNILIAIILQSFEQAMTQKTAFEYRTKCALNLEYGIYHNSVFGSKPRPCSILTINKNDKDEYQNQWSGFIQTLKVFVSSENTKLKN